MSVVFFSKNNKRSGSSKLIEIKYLVVQDKIKDGLIVVKHTNTETMIADPLTKGLAAKVFKEHVIKMGVVNSFDILQTIMNN